MVTTNHAPPLPGRTDLDRVADRAQDAADLAAQEDEGDDRDDRDEGEDQRVFRETLAFLVAAKRGEQRVEERLVTPERRREGNWLKVDATSERAVRE